MPRPSMKRVEELFHAALALTTTDRAKYLDSACAGDGDLRLAVEGLLHHDEALTETDQFLTSPIANQAERFRPGSPTKPTSTTGVPAQLPQIPGFEALSVLGHGGMGIVFKARQVQLNRNVAIKMLSPLAIPTSEQLARFRSEAEILARLRNPNIVPIYDVGECDGRPYFVMEFVDGPTLGQFLSGKPQDPSASARMMETLARTIQVVHDGGIIHRDLKPANVLLELGGLESSLHSATPKITDFGVAKDPNAGRDLTSTGTMMGTPCYMAPEQARSNGPAVGPAADIYSLGAILYELLTGRPPFSTGSAEETIFQVLNDEPISPARLEPAVPEDLVTICLKCLEKSPAKRYASASDLAEDLRRFLAGEPIRARPVGPVEHCIRWCRRRPLVAALTALCALLIIGLLTTVLIYNERLRVALTQEEIHTENQRNQIVQLNVNIGVIAADSGEFHVALLRFTEALRLDKGNQGEQNHRVRIADLLRLSPTLTQHRFVDRSIVAVGIHNSKAELALLRGDRSLEISDALTGQLTGKQVEISASPRHVALSDGDRWIAVVDNDDNVHLWDRQGGTARTLPRRVSAKIARMTFHSDESMLAIHHVGLPPVLWSLSTETPAEKPTRGGGTGLTALSENGNWMVRIEGDSIGRVYELATTEESRLFGLRAGIVLAAVSNDGRRIVIANSNRTLALFDATGEGWRMTNVRLPTGFGEMSEVRFSFDGRRLLLTDRAGSVCVCNAYAARFDSMIRPLGPLISARFLDDRQLLTVTKSGLIRVWELPSESDSPSRIGDNRPVDELIELSQILAGSRINPQQEFEKISASELQSLWDRRTVR